MKCKQLVPHDPSPSAALKALGFQPLSEQHPSHSVWGNMVRAMDGDLYVAAGNHEVFGGDSWLYRIPQEENKPQQCFSVRQVIGARSGQSAVGEAKIHTRLQQADDGWIYMATMQGGIGHLTKWSHYAHPSQYEGGLLLRYHPQREEVECLGIPVEREGLQTMIMDRRRRQLYFVTWPKKQFVRYDLNKREATNFGVIAWSPTDEAGTKQHYARDLFIDNDGIVYCTNNFGELVYLRPGDHELTETNLVIRQGDSLRTHVSKSDGTFCLCTSQGHLMHFDPSTFRVTYLGPTTPAKPVYTPNLVLSRDEKVLVYLAGSHGSYAEGGMQLVSFDTETSTHTVHGFVDERLSPAYCYASGVDGCGHWVFAVNGGEPPDSYVVSCSPKMLSSAKWLGPEAPRKEAGFVFGPGSEGNVAGWIVTDTHDLTGPGQAGIPHDRCRVTALAADPDRGHVYGGTSAGSGGAFLFAANGDSSEIIQSVDLSIHLQSSGSIRGLALGADGLVYGGSLDLVQSPLKEPRFSEVPWPCIPSDYHGGQIFVWDPDSNRLENLGTPVRGQGIYTVCAGPGNHDFYALTFPHGYLVHWSIERNEPSIVAQLYGVDAPALRPDEFALATLEYMSTAVYESRLNQLAGYRGVPVSALPRDILLKKAYLPRVLAADGFGRIYGSGFGGTLFRFDPQTRTLENISARLPLAMGTEYGLIAEPALSAAVTASDGMIYGGTVQDGYLFQFDAATGSVRNLGKPTRQGHIRGLAEWKDRVFGIVGETTGKTHLFAFDPTTASIEDLGVLQGRGRRGFAVNICDAIAACGDRLYIGQSERISALLSVTELTYEPYQSP